MHTILCIEFQRRYIMIHLNEYLPTSIIGLKAEFEGEGASREQIASEFALCNYSKLDYLVKIGGCEAKTDIAYLMNIGVTGITAPMVETEFSMMKYMSAIKSATFSHIGVTIETKTAVSNIDEILNAGTLLTNVTVGRSDLNLSLGNPGPLSDTVINSVITVAKQAKKRNLVMTMGGSICVNTRELFRNNQMLRDHVSFIETRKVVMSTEQFVSNGVFEEVIAYEVAGLKREYDFHIKKQMTLGDRIENIKSRL